MDNVNKKSQFVYQYLISEYVSQECKGFYYLQLLITKNVDKNNVVGLSLNEMVKELGTDLNMSEATLFYHFKVVMRKTNQKRKENSLPEYTLRKFVTKTFIDLQNNVPSK